MKFLLESTKYNLSYFQDIYDKAYKYAFEDGDLDSFHWWQLDNNLCVVLYDDNYYEGTDDEQEYNPQDCYLRIAVAPAGVVWDIDDFIRPYDRMSGEVLTWDYELIPDIDSNEGKKHAIDTAYNLYDEYKTCLEYDIDKDGVAYLKGYDDLYSDEFVDAED